MPDSANYGIVGNVSAQNLAVGQNARIDVRAWEPRLSEQLEALRLAIAAFDGDPGTRRELEVAGQEVAQALDEPAPDAERALARLSRIASAAGSAGTIASAATALTGLVQALL
jgi:hypothetical protein